MKRIVAVVLVLVMAFVSYRIFHSRVETLARQRVLAQEERRPAPPFRLADLQGRFVSLEDFRGKVAVLDFWATWCGPCVKELEDLKVAYEKYRNDPKVTFAAISVDTDPTLVAPHVKRYGYPFRVLLTDGTVEGPYDTARIPRLYIVDARGNIRFKVEGYDRGADNVKQLGWMIEAAMKP